MTMRNLLEMIYEFQRLSAKRDRLEVPLDDDETMRLLGLSQLLTRDGDPGRARTMPRLPFPKTVSFTLPGGFEAGEVRNLSGKGIAIATGRPPAIGTRVIVRMLDDAAHAEFFFPCRVVWARRAPLPGMGLVFDGVPTKSDYLAHDDTGVWKRSFTIGTPRKDSHAA
ncbi:MAG: PilZ domain-containing protein [Myxococcota bacterium]|nr:PilZ domain-containing protein [Myxococcota bacterium]